MASQLFGLLAAASLVSSGMVAASATRSADALPGVTAVDAGDEAGGKCRVSVDRSGAPGTSMVTRASGADGCVCTIKTGPADANGAAESVVAALLRDRECEGAPPADHDTPHGGGGSGAILGGIIAAGAIGGLAAGLGGSDSNG